MTGQGSRSERSRRSRDRLARPMTFMILFNYMAFAHGVGVGALLGYGTFARSWIHFVGGLGALYLLPPLVVRCARFVSVEPRGVFPLGSSPSLVWWFMAQWQVVFNRLPWLEELLRLVPGVYSSWLRLWGARIGRWTYWSPGVRILDRQYLRVGDRVVFGAGVRVNAHVIHRRPGSTDAELFVDDITIGSRCLVGGYSLLPPSTAIPAGVETEGDRVLRTYMVVRNPWANAGSPHIAHPSASTTGQEAG